MNEDAFPLPGLPSLTEERSHPNHWYNRAADLRAAAGATWYAMEQDHKQGVAQALGLGEGYSLSIACRPVYHMLCGLALEVIIKSVMAQRGMKVREIHDLNNLATEIGVTRTQSERALLKFYTSSVIWAGRYPTPRNCSDEALRSYYQDASQVLTKPTKKFGSLQLRVSSGATDWDHFHALWLRFSNEFQFR